MLLIQQVGEVKPHEKEDRGWLRVRDGRFEGVVEKGF